MREGEPSVRVISSVGLWCIIKLKKITSTLAPKTQGILFRGGNRFCCSVIIILKIIRQFVKLPKNVCSNKYIPSFARISGKSSGKFGQNLWEIRAKVMRKCFSPNFPFLLPKFSIALAQISHCLCPNFSFTIFFFFFFFFWGGGTVPPPPLPPPPTPMSRELLNTENSRKLLITENSRELLITENSREIQIMRITYIHLD